MSSTLNRWKFPDLGVGMWWALQTVTTVGYGDVTPHDTVGRLVGAVIMLESIAFGALAGVTSISQLRRSCVLPGERIGAPRT